MKRVTLRQVREMAAQLPSDMPSHKKLMAITDMIDESDFRYINERHIVNTSNYEHSFYVDLDFDEDDKGILMGEFFDYDEVEKYSEIASKKCVEDYGGEFSDEFCEWYDANSPKPQFTIEVPLTRGYSDTSRRDDTTFSSLDLDMAITEALDEKFGCGKVRPWMLRGLISADELGLTEEEFEMELEEFCA